MTETDGGAGMTEEPQDERGAPGSRDGGGGPADGPTDRPVGTSEARDETSVDPQDARGDSPHLPSGG